MAVKKTATKAPASAAAAATTPSPVVETPAQPVVDTPAVSEDVAQSRFVTILEKLVSVANVVKELTNEVKTLQKEYVKNVKSASKRTRKSPAANNGVKRAPSGFAKPARLSDELCAFLGIPAGSERARTDVTRMLNEYIKTHKLQDDQDKRRIKPDEALKKIMNIKDDVPLTYFNLQTHIKHHFVRV
jgi:chromatin remodeling complex protein RSC6